MTRTSRSYVRILIYGTSASSNRKKFSHRQYIEIFATKAVHPPRETPEFDILLPLYGSPRKTIGYVPAMNQLSLKLSMVFSLTFDYHWET